MIKTVETKAPGYSVFVGKTCVAFININEKALSKDTVEDLRDNPEGLTAVLAKAELRPFQAKVEDASISDILHGSKDADASNATNASEEDAEMPEEAVA